MKKDEITLDTSFAKFPKGTRIMTLKNLIPEADTLRSFIGYSVHTLRHSRNIGKQTIDLIQFILNKNGESLDFDEDKEKAFKIVLSYQDKLKRLEKIIVLCQNQYKDLICKILDIKNIYGEPE